MNTSQLLKNTLHAYQNSAELKKLSEHIATVKNSTQKLKEEFELLLPQQAKLSETVGIVSSVLENIELEVSTLLKKEKELQISLLTEHFVAPIMAYIQKTLSYTTRVQINYKENDTEVQIEVITPAGSKTITLVPDFTKERVLFVANPALCNLSPLGTLTNAFGHELLVAPAEFSTLLSLLAIQ